MTNLEIKEPEIYIYVDNHLYYFDNYFGEFIQSY